MMAGQKIFNVKNLFSLLYRSKKLSESHFHHRIYEMAGGVYLMKQVAY